MPFRVNKKREDSQKIRRERIRAIKRNKQQARSLEKTDTSLDVSLNEHQRRARASNPTVPIKPSKKKEKKMRKLAWISQKLGDEYATTANTAALNTKMQE